MAHHIVNTIYRTETQQIKLSVDEYNGRKIFNIRVWVLNDNEEWIPTRRGIQMYEKEIDQLIESAVSAKSLFP